MLAASDLLRPYSPALLMKLLGARLCGFWTTTICELFDCLVSRLLLLDTYLAVWEIGYNS